MNAKRHPPPAAATAAALSEGYRFDAAHDAIRFSFSDGRRKVQGLVSRECLEDDFQVQTDDLKDWLNACLAFADQIESTARELWQAGAPEPVVVKTGNVSLFN